MFPEEASLIVGPLEFLVGEWPKADESLLWGLGRVLSAAGDDWAEQSAALQRLMDKVSAAYPEGEASGVIGKFFDDLHKALADLSSDAVVLAAAANQFGNGVQETKLYDILGLIELIFGVLGARAAGPGAPYAEAIERLKALRWFVRGGEWLESQIVLGIQRLIPALRTPFGRKVANDLLKLARGGANDNDKLLSRFIRKEAREQAAANANPLAQLIAKGLVEIPDEALEEFGQEAVQGSIVGLIQADNPGQAGFDWGRFWQNQAVAAIAGGFAGPVGTAAAVPFGRAFQKGGWAGARAGAVVGGTAGFAGAVGGLLGGRWVTGQWSEIDLYMFTSGIAGGIGPSMIHGFRGAHEYDGFAGGLDSAPAAGGASSPSGGGASPGSGGPADPVGAPSAGPDGSRGGGGAAVVADGPRADVATRPAKGADPADADKADADADSARVGRPVVGVSAEASQAGQGLDEDRAAEGATAFNAAGHGPPGSDGERRSSFWEALFVGLGREDPKWHGVFENLGRDDSSWGEGYAGGDDSPPGSDGFNEAKQIYRSLSKEVHPDRISGLPFEQQQFCATIQQRINDAFSSINAAKTSGRRVDLSELRALQQEWNNRPWAETDSSALPEPNAPDETRDTASGSRAATVAAESTTATQGSVVAGYADRPAPSPASVYEELSVSAENSSEFQQSADSEPVLAGAAATLEQVEADPQTGRADQPMGVSVDVDASPSDQDSAATEAAAASAESADGPTVHTGRDAEVSPHAVSATSYKMVDPEPLEQRSAKEAAHTLQALGIGTTRLNIKKVGDDQAAPDEDREPSDSVASTGTAATEPSSPVEPESSDKGTPVQPPEGRRYYADVARNIGVPPEWSPAERAVDRAAGGPTGSSRAGSGVGTGCTGVDRQHASSARAGLSRDASPETSIPPIADSAERSSVPGDRMSNIVGSPGEQVDNAPSGGSVPETAVSGDTPGNTRPVPGLPRLLGKVVGHLAGNTKAQAAAPPEPPNVDEPNRGELDPEQEDSSSTGVTPPPDSGSVDDHKLRRDGVRSGAPNRDGSDQPASGSSDGASESWAAEVRRGLLAVLPRADRMNLGRVLNRMTDAELARTVGDLSPAYREIVDRLRRDSRPLPLRGFDDDVVLAAVGSVAAGVGVELEGLPRFGFRQDTGLDPYDEERVDLFRRGFRYWPFASESYRRAVERFVLKDGEIAVLAAFRAGLPIDDSVRRSDSGLFGMATRKVLNRLRGHDALLSRARTYLLTPALDYSIGDDAAAVRVPKEWLPRPLRGESSDSADPADPADPPDAVVSAVRQLVQQSTKDEADYLLLRFSGLAPREVLAVMGSHEVHHRRWEEQAERSVVAALAAAGIPADPTGSVLAGSAPVVAVPEGVGPHTAAALQDLAIRMSPEEVTRLRRLLWLPDDELGSPRDDVAAVTVELFEKLSRSSISGMKDSWSVLLAAMRADGYQVRQESAHEIAVTVLRSAATGDPSPVRVLPQAQATAEAPSAGGAGASAERETRGFTWEFGVPGTSPDERSQQSNGTGQFTVPARDYRPPEWEVRDADEILRWVGDEREETWAEGYWAYVRVKDELADVLGGLDCPPEMVAAAEVLAAHLMWNAAVHGEGRGLLTIRVEAPERRLRIAVYDTTGTLMEFPVTPSAHAGEWQWLVPTLSGSAWLDSSIRPVEGLDYGCSIPDDGSSWARKLWFVLNMPASDTEIGESAGSPVGGADAEDEGGGPLGSEEQRGEPSANLDDAAGTDEWFDALWTQRADDVYESLKGWYSDPQLLGALRDAVRDLARHRLALFDGSAGRPTDPVAWLRELAAAVAADPKRWADEVRRGVSAVLDGLPADLPQREDIERILATADAAVLARSVDGSNGGRREIVDRLRGGSRSSLSGFDDAVVVDSILALAGEVEWGGMVRETIDKALAAGRSDRVDSGALDSSESEALRLVRESGSATEADDRALVTSLSNVLEALRRSASFSRSMSTLVGLLERLRDSEFGDTGAVRAGVESVQRWREGGSSAETVRVVEGLLERLRRNSAGVERSAAAVPDSPQRAHADLIDTVDRSLNRLREQQVLESGLEGVKQGRWLSTEEIAVVDGALKSASDRVKRLRSDSAAASAEALKDCREQLARWGVRVEQEHRVLAAAVEKARAIAGRYSGLSRVIDEFLLGPAERRLRGEGPAVAQVPDELLPRWFLEGGETADHPGGMPVEVVSALRSAVRDLERDNDKDGAHFLRLRLTGLAPQEALVVMGLSGQNVEIARGTKPVEEVLRRRVGAKIAPRLLAAALAVDPDLLRRGCNALMVRSTDVIAEFDPIVEDLISGGPATVAAMHRDWSELTLEEREVRRFANHLSEVCLAEWVPTVPVHPGVRPVTTTVLRALAARVSISPTRVQLLRLLLRLPDHAFAARVADIPSTMNEIAGVALGDGQELLSSAMREDRYSAEPKFGTWLMEFIRAEATGEIDPDRPGHQAWYNSDGRPVGPHSAATTPHRVPTTAGSGIGSQDPPMPWPDEPDVSLPDPREVTDAEEVQAIRATGALVRGVSWENLSPEAIEALVRFRPETISKTDAPWPVRHMVSMMLLARHRATILNGPEHNVASDDEHEKAAAQAELAELGKQLRRVAETVAALGALDARAAAGEERAGLEGKYRGYLGHYDPDPDTGSSVLVLTNDDGGSSAVDIGHLVSAGATPRHQFGQAVDVLVDSVRQEQARQETRRGVQDRTLCAAARVSGLVGADPFGLPAEREPSPDHVVVHGVPEDADLPWNDSVKVAAAYLDRLRETVYRHRWFEPDDPALQTLWRVVELVVGYQGDVSPEEWMVSGEQVMGERTLVLAGARWADFAFRSPNHPSPVHGPSAADPGLTIDFTLPLNDPGDSAAIDVIADLAIDPEQGELLRQQLVPLFGAHQPSAVRVRMRTVGGELRTQVTIPDADGPGVAMRETLPDAMAQRLVPEWYRMFREFARAAGIDENRARFYWPVMRPLAELIRRMDGIEAGMPVEAADIARVASMLVAGHDRNHQVEGGTATVESMLDSAMEAYHSGVLGRGGSGAVEAFELGAVMHLTRLYAAENTGSGRLWNLPAEFGCTDPLGVMELYWKVFATKLHEAGSEDGRFAPVTLEEMRNWKPGSGSYKFSLWAVVEYIERNYGSDRAPGTFDRRHEQWHPSYRLPRIHNDDVQILGKTFEYCAELHVEGRHAIDFGAGSNLYPAMLERILVGPDGRITRLVYRGNAPELEYNESLSESDSGIYSHITPIGEPLDYQTLYTWLSFPPVIAEVAEPYFSEASAEGLLRGALDAEVVPGDIFEYSPLGVLEPALGLMTATKHDIGTDFYTGDSVFKHLGMYYATVFCELHGVDRAFITGRTINRGNGYWAGSAWFENTRFDGKEWQGFMAMHPRVVSFLSYEHHAVASFTPGDEGLAVGVAVLRPHEPDPAEAEVESVRAHLVDLVSRAVSPETARTLVVAATGSENGRGPREQRQIRKARTRDLDRAGLLRDDLDPAISELTAQLLENSPGVVDSLRRTGVDKAMITGIRDAISDYLDTSVTVFRSRIEAMRREMREIYDGHIVGVLRGVGVEAGRADDLAAELVRKDADGRPDPDPVYARLREENMPDEQVSCLSGAVAYYLGLECIAAKGDTQVEDFDQWRSRPDPVSGDSGPTVDPHSAGTTADASDSSGDGSPDGGTRDGGDLDVDVGRRDTSPDTGTDVAGGDPPDGAAQFVSPDDGLPSKSWWAGIGERLIGWVFGGGTVPNGTATAASPPSEADVRSAGARMVEHPGDADPPDSFWHRMGHRALGVLDGWGVLPDPDHSPADKSAGMRPEHTGAPADPPGGPSSRGGSDADHSAEAPNGYTTIAGTASAEVVSARDRTHRHAAPPASDSRWPNWLNLLVPHGDAQAGSASDGAGSDPADRTLPSRVPDPAAKPQGRRTRIRGNVDEGQKRRLELENLSAEILARLGYRIEQNPVVEGNRNPDYRIEGRIFDHYAPNTRLLDSIVVQLSKKIAKGQADRIVVNLADSLFSPLVLGTRLGYSPTIRGLVEVIAIDQQHNVIHIHPVGEAFEVKTFGSAGEARVYFQEHWGDADEHEEAFRDYAAEGGAINKYLRGASGWERYTQKGWSAGDVDAVVSQLDAAMKPLPETIAVTRYLSPRRVGDLESLRRGHVVCDPAFISTIPGPEGFDYFKHRVGVLHLIVARGTPAAFIKNGSDGEVLLARNLPWTVIGKAEIDGKRHIYGVVNEPGSGMPEHAASTTSDRGPFAGTPTHAGSSASAAMDSGAPLEPTGRNSVDEPAPLHEGTALRDNGGASGPRGGNRRPDDPDQGGAAVARAAAPAGGPEPQRNSKVESAEPENNSSSRNPVSNDMSWQELADQLEVVLDEAAQELDRATATPAASTRVEPPTAIDPRLFRRIKTADLAAITGLSVQTISRALAGTSDAKKISRDVLNWLRFVAEELGYEPVRGAERGWRVDLTVVARDAGVSRGTVHKVLNRTGRVEPDTARRVLSAAYRLLSARVGRVRWQPTLMDVVEHCDVDVETVSVVIFGAYGVHPDTARQIRRAAERLELPPAAGGGYPSEVVRKLAGALGVRPVTVSRVLDCPDVNVADRRRVLAAVEDLGYRPRHADGGITPNERGLDPAGDLGALRRRVLVDLRMRPPAEWRRQHADDAELRRSAEQFADRVVGETFRRVRQGVEHIPGQGDPMRALAAIAGRVAAEFRRLMTFQTAVWDAARVAAGLDETSREHRILFKASLPDVRGILSALPDALSAEFWSLLVGHSSALGSDGKPRRLDPDVAIRIVEMLSGVDDALTTVDFTHLGQLEGGAAVDSAGSSHGAVTEWKVLDSACRLGYVDEPSPERAVPSEIEPRETQRPDEHVDPPPAHGRTSWSHGAGAPASAAISGLFGLPPRAHYSRYGAPGDSGGAGEFVETGPSPADPAGPERAASTTSVCGPLAGTPAHAGSSPADANSVASDTADSVAREPRVDHDPPNSDPTYPNPPVTNRFPLLPDMSPVTPEPDSEPLSLTSVRVQEFDDAVLRRRLRRALGADDFREMRRLVATVEVLADAERCARRMPGTPTLPLPGRPNSILALDDSDYSDGGPVGPAGPAGLGAPSTDASGFSGDGDGGRADSQTSAEGPSDHREAWFSRLVQELNGLIDNWIGVVVPSILAAGPPGASWIGSGLRLVGEALRGLAWRVSQWWDAGLGFFLPSTSAAAAAADPQRDPFAPASPPDASGEWVAAARDGDWEALVRLCKRYGDTVTREAASAVGDRGTAETIQSLVRETFLRATRAITPHADISDVGTWLAGVAGEVVSEHGRFIRFKRDLWRMRTAGGDGAAASGEQQLLASATRPMLLRCLYRLPPDEADWILRRTGQLPTAGVVARRGAESSGQLDSRAVGHLFELLTDGTAQVPGAQSRKSTEIIIDALLADRERAERYIRRLPPALRENVEQQFLQGLSVAPEGAAENRLAQWLSGGLMPGGREWSIAVRAYLNAPETVLRRLAELGPEDQNALRPWLLRDRASTPAADAEVRAVRELIKSTAVRAAAAETAAPVAERPQPPSEAAAVHRNYSDEIRTVWANDRERFWGWFAELLPLQQRLIWSTVRVGRQPNNAELAAESNISKKEAKKVVRLFAGWLAGGDVAGRTAVESVSAAQTENPNRFSRCSASLSDNERECLRRQVFGTFSTAETAEAMQQTEEQIAHLRSSAVYRLALRIRIDSIDVVGDEKAVPRAALARMAGLTEPMVTWVLDGVEPVHPDVARRVWDALVELEHTRAPTIDHPPEPPDDPGPGAVAGPGDHGSAEVGGELSGGVDDGRRGFVVPDDVAGPGVDPRGLPQPSASPYPSDSSRRSSGGDSDSAAADFAAHSELGREPGQGVFGAVRQGLAQGLDVVLGGIAPPATASAAPPGASDDHGPARESEPADGEARSDVGPPEGQDPGISHPPHVPEEAPPPAAASAVASRGHGDMRGGEDAHILAERRHRAASRCVVLAARIDDLAAELGWDLPPDDVTPDRIESAVSRLAESEGGDSERVAELRDIAREFVHADQEYEAVLRLHERRHRPAGSDFVIPSAEARPFWWAAAEAGVPEAVGSGDAASSGDPDRSNPYPYAIYDHAGSEEDGHRQSGSPDAAARTNGSGVWSETGGGRFGPEIQANRGWSGAEPPNTLLAFYDAMQLGVDGLRVDIGGMTKDGVPVVHHSSVLDRATVGDTYSDGPHEPYAGTAISELTLAQICTLDVIDPNFGDATELPGSAESENRGIRSPIPIFETVCRLAAGRGATHTLTLRIATDPSWGDDPHRSHELVEAVVSLADRYGVSYRLETDDPDMLAVFREVAPEILRVAAIGEASAAVWCGGDPAESEHFVAAAAAAGADWLAIDASMLDTAELAAEVIRQAAHAGRRVAVRTVDDPDAMRRFLDTSGVHAIITNRPDQLREVMISKGMVPPDTRWQIAESPRELDVGQPGSASGGGPSSSRVARHPTASLDFGADLASMEVLRLGGRPVHFIAENVEPRRPLTEIEWRLVLTRAEREWLDVVGDSGGAQWGRIVLSAKESARRAYLEMTGHHLGNQDIEITMYSHEKLFRARVADGSWDVLSMSGRFSLHGNEVRTVIGVHRLIRRDTALSPPEPASSEGDRLQSVIAEPGYLPPGDGESGTQHTEDHPGQDSEERNPGAGDTGSDVADREPPDGAPQFASGEGDRTAATEVAVRESAAGAAGGHGRVHGPGALARTELIQTTWAEFCRDDPGAVAVHRLEAECWPSFMLTPYGTMRGRMETFPEGQLCLVDPRGRLVAALSLNRIHWDCDPASLRTWDAIAGRDGTYRETFDPEGNTLCMMAMNVSPEGRGRNLTAELIEQLVEFADRHGIEHIIGCFRPNGYGAAVTAAHRAGRPIPDFEDYVRTRRSGGDLIDPWLRTLTKHYAMDPMAIAYDAMQIRLDAVEVEYFQGPDWELVDTDRGPAWSTGDTGFIYPQDDGSYLYREHNVWGRILRAESGDPLRPPPGRVRRTGPPSPGAPRSRRSRG
ncbi:glycerophosphodiester phosphodiesterase family protein [Nocardia sp. NBC_00416]|uniref:glycerophosphodiester phosphodiesterase family protein n=1 Tax=Nocardia sp. NBC_00416 TaxID=2975991 RepID=UPI002E1CFB83